MEAVVTVTRSGHPFYALSVPREEITRWGLKPEDVAAHDEIKPWDTQPTKLVAGRDDEK
ncbi:hypothetical protein [Streptomyces griseosporeus]|uniref:hypothetical protein n=1 Tax=Streptomyces griseosporeus TaxID=1910 RepID=UPI0036FAF8E3